MADNITAAASAREWLRVRTLRERQDLENHLLANLAEEQQLGASSGISPMAALAASNAALRYDVQILQKALSDVVDAVAQLASSESMGKSGESAITALESVRTLLSSSVDTDNNFQLSTALSPFAAGASHQRGPVFAASALRTPPHTNPSAWSPSHHNTKRVSIAAPHAGRPGAMPPIATTSGGPAALSPPNSHARRAFPGGVVATRGPIRPPTQRTAAAAGAAGAGGAGGAARAHPSQASPVFATRPAPAGSRHPPVGAYADRDAKLRLEDCDDDGGGGGGGSGGGGGGGGSGAGARSAHLPPVGSRGGDASSSVTHSAAHSAAGGTVTSATAGTAASAGSDAGGQTATAHEAATASSGGADSGGAGGDGGDVAAPMPMVESAGATETAGEGSTGEVTVSGSGAATGAATATTTDGNGPGGDAGTAGPAGTADRKDPSSPTAAATAPAAPAGEDDHDDPFREAGDDEFAAFDDVDIGKGPKAAKGQTDFGDFSDDDHKAAAGGDAGGAGDAGAAAADTVTSAGDGADGADAPASPTAGATNGDGGASAPADKGPGAGFGDFDDEDDAGVAPPAAADAAAPDSTVQLEPADAPSSRPGSPAAPDATAAPTTPGGDDFGTFDDDDGSPPQRRPPPRKALLDDDDESVLAASRGAAGADLGASSALGDTHATDNGATPGTPSGPLLDDSMSLGISVARSGDGAAALGQTGKSSFGDFGEEDDDMVVAPAHTPTKATGKEDVDDDGRGDVGSGVQLAASSSLSVTRDGGADGTSSPRAGSPLGGSGHSATSKAGLAAGSMSAGSALAPAPPAADDFGDFASGEFGVTGDEVGEQPPSATSLGSGKQGGLSAPAPPPADDFGDFDD